MKQFQYRIISNGLTEVNGPWKNWFVGKGVDSQWQWEIVTKDPDWRDGATLWEMRSNAEETG